MPPKILSGEWSKFFREEVTFTINSTVLGLLGPFFQFRDKLMLPP